MAPVTVDRVKRKASEEASTPDSKANIKKARTESPETREQEEEDTEKVKLVPYAEKVCRSPMTIYELEHES
ncbi:histone acetyltransferase [Microsporum audouinii]